MATSTTNATADNTTIAMMFFDERCPGRARIGTSVPLSGLGGSSSVMLGFYHGDRAGRGAAPDSVELDAHALVGSALRSGLHDADLTDLEGRANVRAAVGLLVDPLDVDHTDGIDIGWDQVGLRADQVGIGERLGPWQEQDVHVVAGGEGLVQARFDLLPELLADVIELEVHPSGAADLHVAPGDLRVELRVHDPAEGVQRRVGPHDRSAPLDIDRDPDGRVDVGNR